MNVRCKLAILMVGTMGCLLAAPTLAQQMGLPRTVPPAVATDLPTGTTAPAIPTSMPWTVSTVDDGRSVPQAELGPPK
jgi:hypothetical protein